MSGVINFCIVFLLGNTAMAQIEVPRPTLIFEPEQPVYFAGESLSLRCFSEMQTRITGYNFFRDSELMVNNSASSRLMLQLSLMHAGNYFCTYYTEATSRVPESNSITLKVIDLPPAPALLFVPQRNVFLVNQSVTIRCDLPEKQGVTAVSLYQNDRIIYGADNFGGLSLTKTERSNTGNYTCRYKTDIPGRNGVDSRPSDRKPLIVIDMPPTPSLRYGKNILNQSDQVEIVCEISNPSFSLITGYRLYRNGGEIFSVRQKNQFVINYSLEFDGCYSCRSFVEMLGEEILSPKSAEIFLTLEANNRRNCQEQNSASDNGLSLQGIKLYASVLIGKLIVLISILLTFGIHLLVIRNKKQDT
ncbi:immunoglobulin superfamily member 1-like [Dendrobates tinctorius]|uniref:immunoglobulin superfamily member 1-like n=1 Tax=Dendrobates tinctorius TaxID=92724 RepID=UPI003CC9543E